MKFSFNQNCLLTPPNEENHSENIGNKSSTLREIYFKEFEKQTDNIKHLQEQRKSMLGDFSNKNRNNRGAEGK